MIKKTIRFSIILVIICIISLLTLILTNNKNKINNTKKIILEKIEESQLVSSKIQVSATEYYTTNAKVKLSYGQDSGDSGIEGLYYTINDAQTAIAPNDGYEITISDEGTSVVQAYMKDNAGNQSVTVTKTINKDSSGPTIMANLTASDITIRSFKLSIKVKDEISGLDKIEWYYKKSDQSTYTTLTTLCNGELGTTEKTQIINRLRSGTYNVYAKIYDKAKNTTTTGILNVTTQNIEEVPTLIATPSAPTWTNDKVVVTPSSSTITYMSNNGLSLQYQLNSTTGTWITYTTQIEITTNSTTIYYRYTDGVNNGEKRSITISNIDKIKPGNTTVSGTYGAAWKNNVSITLSATDEGGSGIQCYEIDVNGNGYADYNTLSQTGGISSFVPWNGFSSNNVRFRAVDNAGNRGNWSTAIEIHMDTSNPTVPVITLKIANPDTNDTEGIEGDYTSGTKTDRKVVHIYSSTDSGGSGIAYYQYSHNGVNPVLNITNPTNSQIKSWFLNSEGKWTFYVRAVDNAGNVSAWSSSYVVWIDRTPVFTSQEFAYTGNIQEFTVPISGNYKLEVWGAHGGNTALQGGKGGYSVGTRYFEQGTKLYIVVGGKGGDKGNAYGGYNGGGTGGNSTNDEWGSAGGGGGATHIGYTNTLLKNTDRTKVLIVAGGGGGAGVNRGGEYVCYGGAGGGLTGGNGTGVASGQGGTQTSGGPKANNSGGTPTYGVEGAYGEGASADEQGVYGAGGGGGWYGGSSGANYNGSMAGGGGSGYIAAVYNGNTTTGANNLENGKAKIEFLGTTNTTQLYMTPFVVYNYGEPSNACVSFNSKIDKGRFSSGIWYNYGYYSDETTLTLNYNGYDKATIEFEFGGDSFGEWWKQNVSWGKAYINGTKIYSSKDQYPTDTYTLSNYTSNTINLKVEGENIDNTWHVLTYIKIKKVTFYKN